MLYTKRFMKFAFTLVCSACMFSATASAQKAPKTVVDYFMLLPVEYTAAFNDGLPEEIPLTDELRRSLIVVKDVENGFLTFQTHADSDDTTDVQELALFKKTNGDYIVAVTRFGLSDQSSPNLLSYKNGKWTEEDKLISNEITEEMVVKAYKRKFPYSKKPVKDFFYSNSYKSPLFCRLPRIGRTITVLFRYYDENTKAQTDKEVFAFEWDGSKFILKEL